MTKKEKRTEKKERQEKRTIRCRNCFMVDSYTSEEQKCKHCGAKIFIIDSV
ncbi:MAG TPA: hypothetical protein PLQ41_05475 [bacterium]|nr:hypothetical protein [bacterium]HPP29874.1 hypothetical protein [bacterium]